MRRILTVLTVLLIILNISPKLSAASGQELHNSVLSENSEEILDVRKSVGASYSDWKEYLGDDFHSIDFDKIFQVYYLSMKDIVAAYDHSGNFGENILDDYYWVVPTYEVGGEVQVSRNDNSETGWSVRRGTNCSGEMVRNYPNVKFDIVSIYDNIFSAYPDADPETFRFVHTDGLDTHLMYFVCDSVEYLVPYFESADITWSTNERIYTAEEYIEILRKNGTKDTEYSDLDEKNNSFEKTYLLYVLVGSIIVICVTVCAILIVKKKQNTEKPL